MPALALVVIAVVDQIVVLLQLRAIADPLKQSALLMLMIVVSQELGVVQIGTLGGCSGTPGQAFVVYIFATASPELVHAIDNWAVHATHAHVLP